MRAASTSPTQALEGVMFWLYATLSALPNRLYATKACVQLAPLNSWPLVPE